MNIQVVDKQAQILELAQAIIMVVNKADDVIGSEADASDLFRQIENMREVSPEKREKIKRKIKKILSSYIEKNSKTLFEGYAFAVPMIKGFINDM